MKVHGYSEVYDLHNQQDVDDYWNGGSQCVNDTFYYEALNLLGCKRKNILMSSEEDFITEKNLNKFNENIFESYSVRVEDLPSKSKFMAVGILSKITVKLNDKEFTVLYADDMGFEWYYFTREFIKEYSKVTGTKIKYDFLME